MQFKGSFVGIAITMGIAATTNSALAVDPTIISDHQATGQLVEIALKGDESKTYIEPLWEKKVTNSDANENQMSMVKIGDKLYQCIAVFKGGITLRTFSCSDGSLIEEKTGLTFPLGTDISICDRRTDPFITTDDAGNIVVAYLAAQIQSNKTFKISVCLQPVNEDWTAKGDVRISDSFILGSYKNSNTNIINFLFMDRIDHIKGDVVNNSYSFKTLIGAPTDISGEHKGHTYQHDFIYATITQESLTLSKIIHHFYDESRFSHRDCAPFPGKENLIILTNDHKQHKEFVGPAVFDLETAEMHTAENASFSSYLENNLWFSNIQCDQCRGFYPFIHNGHVLAAFGAQCNTTNGTDFQIMEMPDAESFSGSYPLWRVPQTPFAVPERNTFSAMREIVLTESSVAPSADTAPAMTTYYSTETGKVKAEAPENDTHDVSTTLYMYAPGTGLAAYKITTKNVVPTGIVATTTASGISFALNGRTLTIENLPEDTQVALTDMAGHRFRLSSEGASYDLSDYAEGVYILTANGFKPAKLILH